MHEGINRDDGRHWCAPDTTDGSENPLACVCGRVWQLDGNLWSQAGPDVSAQAETDEVDLAPVPGEEPESAQAVDETLLDGPVLGEERADEVDV